MKKFLKISLIFSIPVLIILVVIEILLRRIPNDYSFKSTYLEKNSKKIEVLYLGNSHIYFGVNPEFSALKSFNAAYTSQSVDLDWLIFSKYKDWSQLKYIVLPVDYIALYTQLGNNVEAWRMKNYNLYYGINSSFHLENSAEIFNGKFAKNVDRLNKYYNKGVSDLDCNNLGFGTLYHHTKSTNIEVSSKDAAKRHKVDIKSKLSISNFEYNTAILKNFIRFGKENHVKIVFVATPVSKSYYNITKDDQLKTTISTIKRLVSESNNQCMYLDYMQGNDFYDADFYDGDHLNDMGAKKLTEKLNRNFEK